MIPVKVQCGCGQRYAFEVEAVAGRMPYAVACPVCGADGTEAANVIVASNSPVPSAVVVPAGGARLRVSAPATVAATASPPAPVVHLAATAAAAPMPRGSVSHLPRVDRTQAEHEARAKVSWGDPPEAVVSFLMIQGLTYEEASELVQVMFKERAVIVRKNGFIKIFTGIGLACVPVAAFFIFTSMGYLPLKIFAVTIIIGLWGCWRILKGLFMVLAPRSEPGDVAEQ